MLDNTYSLVTPELITLKLKPAGIVPRIIAWMIDILIQIFCIGLMTLVLLVFGGILGNLISLIGIEPTGKIVFGLITIGLFLIFWFYSAFFEAWNKGRTPGKMLMGLRVIKEDGTPITLGESVIRSLMRYADFMPAFYGAGILSMMLTPNRQRLGDILANTIVCYKETQQNWKKIPYVTPIPPNVSLDIESQQLIINFAERTHTLSRARQEQLALNLPTLAFSDNPDEPQGAARLVGIANYLIGRESA